MIRKPSVSNSISCLVLGISLAGCGHQIIPVDVPVPSLSIKSLPLHVALVPPESLKTAKIEERISCIGPIVASFGEEFSKEFGDALGRAFERVETISDKAAAVGKYDLLIEPALPELKLEGHCAGSSAMGAFGLLGVVIVAATGMENSVEAQASLHTTVMDTNGQSLLTDDFQSGQIKRIYPAMQSASPHLGQAINEALGDVVREVTQRLVASPKVQEYALVLAEKRTNQKQ